MFIFEINLRRARIAAICILIIVIAVSLIFWVQQDTVKYVSDNKSDESLLEKAMDASIIKNLNDFTLWYKSNILIQCTTILSGVGATILAAITTDGNTKRLKIYSILLTSVTTILVSGQSTFHIRENLDTFIRINTDLGSLQTEYELLTSDSKTRNDKKLIAKIEAQEQRKYWKIQETRLRAYAIIGFQPNLSQKPEESIAKALESNGSK